MKIFACLLGWLLVVFYRLSFSSCDNYFLVGFDLTLFCFDLAIFMTGMVSL